MLPHCSECGVRQFATCDLCLKPACGYCDRCHGCWFIVCERCDTQPGPVFMAPGDTTPHPHIEPDGRIYVEE